jgi:serine/threonine-protein kinase
MTATDTGRIIAGRYRIEALLGRGGFGVVYGCTHLQTGHALVVKQLRPQAADDPGRVERFRREARMAAALRHPHTVRVYDFGELDDGGLFMAMERLEGRDLAAELKELGRLTPERVVRIGVAVCRALAEAHAAGLVHRDIKPANLFLSQLPGQPDFVRVIDFGLARPVDQPRGEALTRTGFCVGTPDYMAPEQVQGQELDGRADLYSVGCVLYECLTGEPPLRRHNTLATLMAQMDEAPADLLQRQPDVPKLLSGVVMRALAKQPAARWSDAEAMARALEHAGRALVVPRGLGAEQRELTGEMTQPMTVPPPKLATPVLASNAKSSGIGPWRWWAVASVVLLAGAVLVVTRPSQAPPETAPPFAVPPPELAPARALGPPPLLRPLGSSRAEAKARATVDDPPALASPMPVLLPDDEVTRVAAHLAAEAQRCAPLWPMAELGLQVQVASDGHVSSLQWLGAGTEAPGAPCLRAAAQAVQVSASTVARRVALVLVRLPTAKAKARRAAPGKAVRPPTSDGAAGDWSL